VPPKAVGEKPVTYLNLGADFPNSKLTIVIFQKDLVNFPLKPSDKYKGMNVCVTGAVKKYKEKLEIIANGPDQIEMK
jgi:DNA/RNA endonuclease YhcR with UshA esterase domain